MRLLLTVVGPDSVPHDLAVDCEEGTTLAQVLPVLGEAAGVPIEPGHPASRLFLGSTPLDLTRPVEDSPVRNGAVVGLGRPVPDLGTEPGGTLELRITSGAGAGTVHRLTVGSWTIGADPLDTVRLDDPWITSTAVQVDVRGDGAVVVTPADEYVGVTRPAPYRRRPLDGPILIPVPPTKTYGTGRKAKKERKQDQRIGLESVHTEVEPDAPVPLLHVARVPLTAARFLEPGAALAVGDTLLELTYVAPPDAQLTPTPHAVELDYNRPPRLLPPERPTQFSYPKEPAKPQRYTFPWPMIVAPVVMGLAMFLIFDRWYMLLFVVLSPLMAIFNMVQNRTTSARRYRDQLAEFRRRRRKVQEDAFRALLEESSARRHDHMDPAQVHLTALGPRARLWERRPTDPDWLHLRVGTTDALSEITIKDPAREVHESDLVWTAPDVPVVVELPEYGVVGLAGPGPARRALAAWLLGQTAVLHSPGEVEIRVAADRATDSDWNWVRWLPHVRAGEDEDGLALVGTDEDSLYRLFGALGSLVSARVEEAGGAGGFGGGIGSGGSRGPGFSPVVVFVEDAARLRLLPGAVSLLRSGPAVGVYFVCMDDDVRRLPEECRAVVSTDGRSTTLERTGRESVDSIRPDLVGPAWCERVARALAPIRDVSVEGEGGAIPSSSRLLDVLHLDPPAPGGIAGRWAMAPRTTRAVIGEAADGPFGLDISRDGPHGLVAGTTGSGKSELLQSIIASLAVGNRPDEFTFVLIDYKGGAAFKDCAHLPHTVGMVTDLDGHLTTRALASLGAELRRREHLLNDAGAKDIEEYTAQRDAGRNPTDEPMARLLIVIDEFAALVAELPDFVTGLVDIARRGRSLGVHLILATQRPSGVVSAEIRSNTNLRIALRVTDTGDSSDVIDSHLAAQIPKSLPGRAYVRSGAGALVQMQSARVGGRPVDVDRAPAVSATALHWTTLARPAEQAAEVEEDVTIPTDLASLVGALREASDGIEPPPTPWLPPLPDLVAIDEVYARFDREEIRRTLRIPFGMVDLPHAQSREVLTYDLAKDANTAFVSQPRMGRSSVLRTVAGVIADSLSVRDVHIHAVDCGNNAMLPLQSLPHVGSVVTRDQPDRLSRLTAKFRSELTRRQELLAVQGYADIEEQRKAVPADERLPYVVVLLDRWEGFQAAFGSLDSGALLDAWTLLFQEAASVGFRFLVSSDRSIQGGRTGMLFEDRYIMNTGDPGDYRAAGMNAKQVPTHVPPGRAFRTGGNAEEIQFALLSPDPEGTAQVREIQRIGRAASAREDGLPGKFRPFRVDQLPGRIRYAEALELGTDVAGTPAAADPSVFPVAVGGDMLAFATLSAVEDGPTFMVLGPRKSGRSNTLQVMLAHLREHGYRILYVLPRTSPLAAYADDPSTFAVLSPDMDKTEGKPVFEEFAELTKDRANRTALVIDDMELLGNDGWIVEGVDAQTKVVRDSESFVVGAGTTSEVGSSFRGPAVALKKSRSGILLNPEAPGDGDIFGTRLPRSIGAGGGNKGRAVVFRAGQWSPGQVPQFE
ncbi:FtsK/SpoIIIE domain-containing protein [Brevibacterium litoralis]|uniref:FtsK/SpoIIIE domain-containing protein n=1 Tax=Brevibacterium litoralis TaxID=3138935 RepID=UPI0032EB7788